MRYNTGSRVNLENLEKKGKFKKVRENLEKSGNFSEKLLRSGKSQGKIFCVPLCYILSIKFI